MWVKWIPLGKACLWTILIDAVFIKMCQSAFTSLLLLLLLMLMIMRSTCVCMCVERNEALLETQLKGKGKTNYAVVCFESPKDKYMEFNFLMRKPISGTVRITIWNLIRLSSATAINTFIAFILLGLGAFFLSFSLNLSPLFQHRGLNTYSYMAAVRLWHGFGSFQYNICQQLFLKHKAMDSKEYSRFFFPLEFFSLKWTMCCDVERSIQYRTRPEW